MERLLTPRVGFALVAALYLLSFPYHPGLRSPNELCRLWQARSLVDFGTLDINGTIRQLGMVGDLSCVAVLADGTLKPCVGPDAPPRQLVSAIHYYPSKAPLTAFLAAPVYWVLERFGPVSEVSQVLFSRLVVTILPALALLWLLRRFLGAYLEPALTDVLVVVYALGTMAFSYAESFMSHQLTAALLFAAFFCAWKVERKDWGERGYLLAGLAAGAVVACEYTGALGVVCVSTYVIAARWKQWPALGRAVALVVVGASPMLAGLLAYHHACFGSAWLSGYKFLNDANYMGWHQGGFLGIKVPDGRAFVLSLFSPLRGLFALSPFLVASLFGVRLLREKHRPLFVFTCVLLVANAYFTSSFAYDSWGWTVGPRHLTPMLPFLLLPLGLLLAQASALARAVIGGLCVSAVLTTGLVCFVNYVPDDVSTSVFGLALPLLEDGFWPVSWLAVALPNPASGALLVGLLLGAVAWVALRFTTGGARPLVLAVAVVAHLGLLRLATTFDDHEKNARTFLESVWLAPSGQRLRL
jgi:hypothetical protein